MLYMRIFSLVFLVLISLNSFSFFDRFYEVLDFQKSNYRFRYIVEPFENSFFGFDIFYKGIIVKLGNRNFGEFEIIDENKEVLYSTYLYDIFCDVGYIGKFFGDWFLSFSFSGRYEYYFLFSDLSLGGKFGIGFSSSPVYFLNNFVIENGFGLEGLFNYSFDKVVDLGIGYEIKQFYQDFYVFISSKVFEYQGFITKINTGVFYGTLKEISPFVKVLFGYNEFVIGYGVLVYSDNIFQDFVVELKM